jgi:competence protein CoiA
MKEHNMLQVFALDNNGVIRHVDEVKRGLACECRCPVCNGPVMAKQGEIKGWHFAHTSGSDCQHAGETALHLAAKQLLMEEHGLMVPEMTISASYQLPDGRQGEASVTRPEMWLDFIDVKSEVNYGSVKPDIIGYLSDTILFIEIAVSHFVDDDKASKLEKAGVATLEVDLSGLIRDDTNWITLREAILESVDQKRWLIELEKNSLELEAREMAMNDALTKPLPAQSKTSGKPPEFRFILNGRRLYVREYPFGLTVWFQYDEEVKDRVKEIAKGLGGNYRPQYKNWLFPPESKPYLMVQLTHLSQETMEVIA